MVLETRSQKYVGHRLEINDIVFSVSDEDSNEIEVTLTIKDYDGFTIDTDIVCYVWASNTAGTAVTAADDITYGTNATLIEALTANGSAMVALKDGAVITVTESTGTDYYINVRAQDGRIFSSGILDFTA